MSEVAFNMGAVPAAPRLQPGWPAAPDSALVAAIVAAHGLRSMRPGEVTLARSTIDETRGARRVELVCLMRGDLTLVRVVIKTGTSQADLAKFAAISALGLPIPRILAILPEHAAVIMEEARGERLDRLLLPVNGPAGGRLPERLLTAAARAGIALAMFHGVAPAQVERLPLTRLLAGLRPAPADLRGELGRAARHVAGRLGAVRDPIERRAVLCHRDLHPRQIFDDGTRSTLVDLDSAGLAHPALDLANFSVGLEVRQPALAPDLIAAFRSGYAAAGGDAGDGAPAETAYRAFTFLRLAVKTCRTQPQGWVESASTLLEQARAALAAAGDRR